MSKTSQLVEQLASGTLLRLTVDARESQVRLLSTQLKDKEYPLLVLEQPFSEVAAQETGAEVDTTTDRGRLIFRGVVSANPAGNTIFSVHEGELRQLRQYVRAQLEVEVAVTSPSGASTVGRTVDVSGGGARIRFQPSVSFYPGATATIGLPIPDAAHVMQVAAVCIDGNPAVGHRFEFTNLRPALEDKICAFVMVIQKELLNSRARL